VEILRSRTGFFRVKLITFTWSQSVDYDYCKAAKKGGRLPRDLQAYRSDQDY